MSNPVTTAPTREELYARMAETSREEVVLEEMIRLGFWPAAGEVPNDPAEEIKRRGELQRELSELRAQQRKLHNHAALVKEARKQRLLASRQKQKETKERHARERAERAAAWKEKQKHAIGYLGAGVSAGLSQTASQPERLQRYNLPQLDDAAAIAQALGITVNELRFLAFSRKTSTVTHYRRFAVPKKTGGERIISAPMPRLKAAQHWVLNNILQPVELHEAAHGFRPQRSIVSNAQPHVAASVVINLDLQDFFPTLSYKRVKGVFKALGYSEAAATIFGLLCTEPDTEKVTLDGKTYYVATGARHLPQGAPTSPALTNILCRRLDKRLVKVAEELGFVYTRYADDLTFSAKQADDRANISRLLRRVEAIVAHEGFIVHPTKTRVMRSSSHQEVTGIVVNHKPGIDKATLKKFRAVLFQIEKDGPDGKHWNHPDNLRADNLRADNLRADNLRADNLRADNLRAHDVLASLRGFANFVYMVDPVKGAAYQQRVRALMERYDWQPPPPRYARKPKTVAAAARTATAIPTEPSTTEPKKPWWKLW